MMVRPLEDGGFKTKTIPNVEFEISSQSEEWFAAIKPDSFVIGMVTEEEARSLIQRSSRCLKAAEHHVP
jgi:hypothetical protein